MLICYLLITFSDDSDGQSDEINFVKENREVFIKLLEMYQSNNLLILDESVYNKNAEYLNKSNKMNKEIYELFSQLCNENYHHLKMQVLIAHALLDFRDINGQIPGIY
ncbi:hypothetical protein [Virgibacillus halodenitrificans]|uniref:hypothetical protein n=1 Tax=Virgibacillus halodenitrificans TaxID=1482 RepID=UPI001679214A|nr:hypothetical protein [Virgibacillus halodenitrificans]